MNLSDLTDEEKLKLNELLSRSTISSRSDERLGYLNGEANLPLSRLMDGPRPLTQDQSYGLQQDNSEPGVRFSQPQAPAAQPQMSLNTIRNNSTGRTLAPTDMYGQPSQSQLSGPITDPTRGYVDTPYGKGMYMKADPLKVVLGDGRIVDLGRDTAAERARMKENLAMDKMRADIAQTMAKPTDPEVSKQVGLLRLYKSLPEGALKQAFGEKHGFAIQKSEKTTEDEKKTAYHANKMLDSINRIKEISAASKDSLSPSVAEATAAATVGPYSGTANVARSGNRQAVFGLQADLIDSLLYLATGAAYNKEQLLQKKESLLPAFTDKPEAIAEKKRSLNEYMKAAKIRAGKEWTPEMEGALTSLYDEATPATTPSSSIASASNKNPSVGVLVPAANEQQALTLPPGTRFRLPDGRTGTAR